MKYALAFLLVLIATPLWAQTDSDDKGSLYVQVDHSATLYLNGVKLKIPKSKAAPKPIAVAIKPGDHIVARLSSTESKYDGYFMLLYVTADKQSQVSFHAVDFKILPDDAMTDFTADQFNGPLHQAVLRPGEEKKRSLFPYKSNCNGFWGDKPECAIGGVVTSDLFLPLLPQ
jgi:hypothetical protein